MLEGHVERYTATSIIGWARDAGNPAEPEYVDIRFDGERIVTLRADLPRPDLDGRRCGFEFLLPAALRHGIKRPLISVTFSRTGEVLGNAPRHLRLGGPGKRVLVVLPAGARYGHDNIRWHERPQEDMIRAYYNVGDMMVFDSTLKLLNFADVGIGNITEPTEKDMDRYNAEFDYCILRGSNYINEKANLKKLDWFLSHLKIPAVAIGVGAQAADQRKLDLPEPTRRVWKLFSDHCASIGVRGNYTAEVLNDIGIHNVDVIGCPSLFRHNDPFLQVTPPAWGDLHNVAFTLRREVSNAYTSNVAQYFDVQKKLIREIDANFGLTVMTHGEPEEKAFFFKHKALIEELRPKMVKSGWFGPKDADLEKIWQSKLFFSNTVADYDAVVRRQDLVVGFRVHGNLPALANKIPSVFVAYDSRSRELAETLSVPIVSMEEALARPLEELYRPELFDAFNRNYGAYYRRMAQFFDRNGLSHNMMAD
jgi:hypothetical protein